MSPRGTVVADRVWKRFRADRNRPLLRDEVARLRARFRGDAATGWRYVLRDVAFRVEPGESLALVGTNGSGKSTMLKIMVGVMFPYAGQVEASGRVGAMIEVAAGIHPELTGRENVHLYGTLLGLSRRDVQRRFDDIVAFAGLEQGIDRQVKFYSSGMKMRLGFAVNAYLEPDVLIVDEVLSVGDAEFQRRCLERMREVLAGGTTLIYVSHDLPTVEAMCERAVWLDQGVMRAEGPTREVLGRYRHALESRNQASLISTGDGVEVTGLEVCGSDGGPVAHSGAPLVVRLTMSADRNRTARVVLGVTEGTATPIFLVQHDVPLGPQERCVTAELDALPLPAGEYSLWLGVVDPNGQDLLPWHPAGHVKVDGASLDPAPTGIVRLSPVVVPATWVVR